MKENWPLVIILALWFIGVLASLGITGFIIWVIWKVMEKYVL